MWFVVLVLTGAVVGLWIARSGDRSHVDQLQRRIEQLERLMFAAPAATAPAAPAPAAPAPVPQSEPEIVFADEQPAPTGPRQRTLVERIIAEHALALVGGLFVLVAAIFFVTYAIDQGWIGPHLRMLLAAAFGIALAGAGLRVAAKLPAEERTGRAIGSLHGVLVGTGAAVTFLAVVAAVRVEEIMPATVGVLAQVLVATPVVWLARTWRSQDLAAFGLGVALAAPMLVGAEATPATIALLAVAIAGSVVLAVTERWPRLLLAAALLTAPQVGTIGASVDDPNLGAVAATLLAWWAALMAGAVGCTLRSEDGAPRSVVATVLGVPLVVPGAFALALDQSLEFDDVAWYSFLFAFAALQLVLAAAIHVRWRARVDVLVVALVGAGLVTAATAIGSATDGVAVTVAWIAEAVALTALWARARGLLAAAFAVAMAIAGLVRVLAADASPELLTRSHGSLVEPLVAVGAVVLGAVAAHALVVRLRPEDDRARTIVVRCIDVLAIVGAWYAGALVVVGATDTLDGAAFALGAWLAVGALTAAVVADRAVASEYVWIAGLAALAEPSRFIDAHAGAGALWVYVPAAALAAGYAVRARTSGGAVTAIGVSALHAAFAVGTALWLVPPTNLRTFDEPAIVEAFIPIAAALVAVLAVLAALDRRPEVDPTWRRAGHAVGAIAGLYVVSVLVVSLFTSVPGTFDQGAQVALTLTWVALGVGALFAGTSERLRAKVELRIGAYALLGLAAVKLVVVDTADFETPMRVLAFLVTGLALLGSAALEQRMRRDDPIEP